MLRHRSVRVRIIVLVLVPVIALIGLYALVIALTTGSYLSLSQAESVRAKVANPTSEVQLQLTRERRLAVRYLARPSHGDLTRLLTQESASDASIRRFTNVRASALAAGSAGEQRAIGTWSAKLRTLRGLRASIVSLSVRRAAADSSYSRIISAGNNVLSQAIAPLLATPQVIQASNLVTLDESLQAASEESDLFSADLIAHSYPAADERMFNRLVVQRRQLWYQAMAGLGTYQSYFNKDIPASAADSITQMENRVITDPHQALGISPKAWTSAYTAYDTGFMQAFQRTASALTDSAAGRATGVLVRLILVVVLGLLVIAGVIAVAVLLGRALLQELDDLRKSALELSSERLPAMLGRLRAGGVASIEAETPQLASGTEAADNEIGQLRQAINYAAQAAIGAAVDEVAIRRGVNDVFRNLARRNQSLLTRQLELLDAMERRVHDPEELADLFRVDHLTTRMRRHAEGLLIVAGGSSGRVWREPVAIMDVMRAAVAEVEDYTRIRVNTRSNALVAGHAVADIIHLLAELVENATTFSPANTPVKIESDQVAKGLIVEIEDRGLGMSEEQVAGINLKLNDPPQLDLSGSEQLGLFIAGQLARRHDVKITMRASAYGGIVAVVLLPTAIVIDADYDEPPSLVGIRELGGRPVPQLPGPADQPDDAAASAGAASAGADGGTAADRAVRPDYLADLPSAASPAASDYSDYAAGPVRQVGRLDLTSGYQAEASPVTGGTAEPASDLPGSPDRDTSPERPVLPKRQPRTPALSFGADPAGLGNFGAPDDQREPPDLDGLPMRVRQANLVPQLRDHAGNAPANQHASATLPPADPAAEDGAPEDSSPEAARNLMSALQRGWERGRSTADQMTDDPDGAQS